MAKIINEEFPEDFALHILDQLMEEKGETLSPLQLITAAQAYATAGVAQATRAANVSLDDEQDASLRRHVEENEGRAHRLGGELPVIEYFPDIAEGSPGDNYRLVSNGKEMYWVHKNATDEEKTAGIELIRFFARTEDTDEVGELEHVNLTSGEVSRLEMDEAYEEFKKDRKENKPIVVGSVSFHEEHTRETTKVLPMTLREKIEADIAARNAPKVTTDPEVIEAAQEQSSV